jgi:hypothetical protein
MALRVNSFRCGNSDAIGGKADIRRSRRLGWSDAFDPNRTSGLIQNISGLPQGPAVRSVVS